MHHTPYPSHPSSAQLVEVAKLGCKQPLHPHLFELKQPNCCLCRNPNTHRKTHCLNSSHITELHFKINANPKPHLTRAKGAYQ